MNNGVFVISVTIHYSFIIIHYQKQARPENGLTRLKWVFRAMRERVVDGFSSFEWNPVFDKPKSTIGTLVVVGL